MQAFRFVDLFAGLGGFHLALARMGGQCVFAAEWKEHLRDLYEKNHGIRPYGDITLVSPKDVPPHDVLTAGFPCQPFSKAGEQLGFEPRVDHRAGLGRALIAYQEYRRKVRNFGAGRGL